MAHTYDKHKEAVSGPKKPIVIKVGPRVDFNKIQKFQEQVKGLGIKPTPLPLCVVKKPIHFKSQPANDCKNKSGIKCLICQRIFENHHSLKSHVDNFHLSPRTKVLGLGQFKCPLCDSESSYRPHVRQHIIDKHCKEVTMEEAENDIDDPGTTDYLQGQGELSEKEEGELSERELENDIDDPGVDILTEFGIQEENEDEEDSKSDVVGHQDDCDPLQIVTIDPDAIRGISMKPQFPCSFCGFISDSELKYKNHVLDKHMLKSLRQVVKTPKFRDIAPKPVKEINTEKDPIGVPSFSPIIPPPPLFRKYYPQDLKKGDIFVCSYCDFKDALNSQVMAHIHAKHPGRPVLVSVQKTPPDVGKPFEVSWPLQQALKAKMEFDDVKPDNRNKAKLKQFKKRLKAEMKQRGKAEKKKMTRFKRTSAEVSSEDRQLAEKAIEDLEARGASTDDLTCHLCDPAKTFAAYRGLLCHYKSHAGHRPFKCDQCQATFTRQHNLKYHLLLHDKDHVVKQPKEYQKHLKSKHKKAENRQRKRTLAEVRGGDKQLAEEAIQDLQSRGASTDDLTCCLCDPAKTFAQVQGLLTHLRSHAGQRPFKCDRCQATFTRQYSLKYHLMTHESWSRFTCPHCNRKFNHPSHFRNHVATKHGDVAKFNCQFCDSVFLVPKEHQKHLKSKHKAIIMGNEKLLQTNKIFVGEILAKDEKKLEDKEKMVKDEEPDPLLSLSLKLEPEPGPGQTLAQVLDRSEDWGLIAFTDYTDPESSCETTRWGHS